ncbi:MAG: dihydrolipoamide acetyltransferase family protein [Desulfobacteraceae bacterium]|jgi:pyruvate dehydrogenase E2 component (dihydrolipoamide acetyltransferase)
MARSFKLPDLGEGIHEGEILAIHIAVGDEVKEGDTIMEVETDKAAVEIPSPYTGTVEQILVKPGDTVKVGDVLMTFSGGEAEAPVEAEKPKEKPSEAALAAAPEPVPSQKREPVPASPATRRLALELGVDLHLVTPTGPSGLVTADDVRAFAEKGEKVVEAPPAPAEPEGARPLIVTAPKLPDFAKWGSVQRVPLRSIRKATAKQMALAWSQIPHVSNQDMVDMTKLDAFRRKHKGEIEAKGGKLTPTVFVLKAVATALKAYPNFNATLDTEAEEIVIKHYYHIGVAVNTKDGLIVPVVRDVDRKSIMELSIELKHLIDKTRARKATLEEMQGGTFTVTNVGPMGGGYFVPIINYPEVAILGTGAARMQPAVIESEQEGFEVVPRLMMPLVLCIDHRVLDGADAIPFMRMIVEAIEDPEELFMMMT